MGEGFVVDQTSFIQLVSPLDALFILFAGVQIGSRTIFIDQITGSVRIIDTERHQEVGAQTDTGEGNFIIGITVTIGILLFESGQNSFQFFNGIGNLQIKVLQPLHVDNRDVAGDGTLGHTGRQRIDMSISRSGDCLQSRHFLKCFLQIGHILIDQVFQWNEVFHVAHDVGLIEGLEAKHHVRQYIRTASQQDGLLIAPVIGGNDLPFNFYIGLFFQIYQEGVVGEGITHISPAHRQHFEGNGFIHNGHSLGMETGGFRQRC